MSSRGRRQADSAFCGAGREKLKDSFFDSGIDQPINQGPPKATSFLIVFMVILWEIGFCAPNTIFIY